MSRLCLAAAALLFVVCPTARAQVLVADSGVERSQIGPGAPAHTIGLERHQQTITLETGRQTFGLRYVVAHDAKRPQVAIPGEGYLGMPRPVDCNWYAGGFFDLQINGRSIGTTPVASVSGRSSPGRGTADFVFDAPPAVVRIRFVAQAGGDCLYAQVLLEPKTPITSLAVVVRCYPSAFTSDGDRHVLTAVRDFKQGQRAALDVAREWWTLYADRVYDAGYVAANHRGVGPCAVVWLPGQTEKATFTVGSYGTDTRFQLKPGRRDVRFVFFDYAGQKNAAARADLARRAAGLVDELGRFAFTDPALAQWPLAAKQAEIRRVLAAVAADASTAAQYQRWAEQLARQLPLLRDAATGAIMAEAAAAQTIAAWEQGLPALKLKALLNGI
jgi:hypothetical protein